MAATREQIMTALLARLTATGAFTTTGRRNRNPETIATVDTPALMLIENSEIYEVSTTSLPAVRRLSILAVAYSDVGDDKTAVPASIVNKCLDAIDAALVPDSRSLNKCTLGGLVQSVVIKGEVKKAPGDRTGKSLAMVPIEILIP